MARYGECGRKPTCLFFILMKRRPRISGWHTHEPDKASRAHRYPERMEMGGRGWTALRVIAGSPRREEGSEVVPRNVTSRRCLFHAVIGAATLLIRAQKWGAGAHASSRPRCTVRK